jgi:FtsZ-binding cell division protein ZapB
MELKLYLMMLIEYLKKDINNSLEKIQENIRKQVEALKEEKNLLKNYRRTQENR